MPREHRQRTPAPCTLCRRLQAAHDHRGPLGRVGMSAPHQDRWPRNEARMETGRRAGDGEGFAPAPSLNADAVHRRPSGERPPLPKNLRGAARFWLVMVALLAMAPFLGLG